MNLKYILGVISREKMVLLIDDLNETHTLTDVTVNDILHALALVKSHREKYREKNKKRYVPKRLPKEDPPVDAKRPRGRPRKILPVEN